MLIGQDFGDLIVSREVRQMSVGYSISRCKLGWTIHGSTFNRETLVDPQINSYLTKFSDSESGEFNSIERIENMVKEYFSLEAIGVSTIARVSADDKRALSILDSTSRHVNGAWEVGLLWKTDNLEIPDSRSNALRRLFLLEKKLDRDESYAKLYYREMDRLIEKGFVIKVNYKPGKRVWYLPHFGVRNINKPGKVRLVFDAAAKSNSISFNDLVLKGPGLLKSLLGVVMRFRQGRVAVKADKKDMFLKIRVRFEDRDAQRFLWRGEDRSCEPEEYVVASVLFGATSSPCTALYVKDKNAKTNAHISIKAADSIIKNCYMDDFLHSCDSEEEAKVLIRDVIRINREADWEMHGWACNRQDVLSEVNEVARTSNNISIDFKETTNKQERVLGLQWVTDSDVLLFSFDNSKISSDLIAGVRRPSKREFLSFIMSIFDPLGLISPITIHARILMQLVWISGIKWDEELQDEDFGRWKAWIKSLEDLALCRINRCYLPREGNIRFIDLHIFCDASAKAFAAVAYWRFELYNGDVHTSIILSKSRVSPLKAVTIPRLELQAAVLAVRVAKLILLEHDFTIRNRVFWSDSRTVLSWIKSDPRLLKTFVANRLGEICEDSNTSEWRWVPGKLNPADDATRMAPDACKENSRWFLGPSFLRETEDQWPVSGTVISNETLVEERIVCASSVVTGGFSFLPDFTRFSRWFRLLRATARFLEAIERWRGRYSSDNDMEIQVRAEALLLKNIQTSLFSREIEELKNSRKIPRDSKLISLCPQLDENSLLRVNGRISIMPDASEKFRPIILDAKHPVVKLIVDYFHIKYDHKSHETVINEVRQVYWIIGLRKCLRNIISNCSICKKWRALPSAPRMADLPAARLGFRLRPFSHCGLDYFGPISVKVGRRREKRWGVLFTCMTVRAVHIEVAHSLSSDSAIMAIKRFAARRGFPQIIYSDNGTNFRGANEELKAALKGLDRSKQCDFAVQKGFSWRFNPPSAPHMGGAWERLIRSVKDSLYFLLREHAPSDETLLTTLFEIEHTINSRPLTHVSPDPRDQEALTPNHFLLGSSSGAVRFSNYETKIKCTRRQWQFVENLADAFWHRWLREYLPSLLPRKKWHDSKDALKVDDMVIICDNQSPRNVWKKGIVSRTFPGKDGEIRVVEVRTSNGMLLRPSHKLIRFA